MTEDDIKLLEQSRGKKARQVAQFALALSAMSDLLHKSNSKYGLTYAQSNCALQC